jgi:hypothetical protein
MSGGKAALENRHTIRLDDETNSLMMAKAGEKKPAEYIREILIEYLKAAHEPLISSATAAQSGEVSSSELRESRFILQEKIESLEELIRAKNETIRILEADKGFLIQDHTRISGQLDRLLMPSSQEIIKKSWWEFWK